MKSQGLSLLAFAVAICIGLVGLFPIHAAAQTVTPYYLQSPQCSLGSGNLTLAEQQPQGATCALLVEGVNATVWATPPFTATTAYPAGNWSVSLWLNTTGTMTQYTLNLAFVDPNGNIAQIGSGLSPVINSTTPNQYIIQIPDPTNATLNSGDSLTLSLLNQDQNGNPTDPGCVFLGSATTPSEVTPPTSNATTTQQQTITPIPIITQVNSTTTQSNTTTQQSVTSSTQLLILATQSLTTLPQPTTPAQPTFITSTRPSTFNLGWAIVIIAAGAGAALVLGVIAIRSSGKRGQIIIQNGRYYCNKHRVPLVTVNGAFWCPFEGRPLKP